MYVNKSDFAARSKVFTIKKSQTIWNSVLFIFLRPPKWAKLVLPIVNAKTIFSFSLLFLLLNKLRKIFVFSMVVLTFENVI